MLIWGRETQTQLQTVSLVILCCSASYGSILRQLQGRDQDTLTEFTIEMVQHREDKLPTLVKHQEELTQEGDLHSLLTLDTGAI